MMASTEADAEFKRRASLANIWQDLVTPVRAILGFQEIILEDAQRLGLEDLLPPLRQVLTAATALCELVDKVGAYGSVDEPTSFQATFRHDLRTPLNAIIGYSEMILEDLEGSTEGGDVLRPDLERLLIEARHLLDRMDAIVDLSRGDIENSEVGENPSRVAGEDAIVKFIRTLRPQTRSPKPNELGKILVVDDNSSNRDLLSRRLIHEGHEVVVTSSGLEAFAVLQEERFDVILLDLLMPDLNGVEVLERLKMDERWRSISVIIISGLSEMDAVIRCIEAGADDYLPKPFNLVLLRARINACLARKRWQDMEGEYLAQLQIEKDRSEAILRNILPAPIIARLSKGEKVIADRFENVSILFADVVDFTPAAAQLTPSQLVERLNGVFSQFDLLALQIGVEKIKTMGDAYMAATGLPEPRPDHAATIAQFGLGMLKVLDRINRSEGGKPIQMRIGIHTGPVVAGVIGHHKFSYDVWGDTVNVASRLESSSLPDKIQVSDSVRQLLAGRYGFEPRGRVKLKGKGVAETFLLIPPGQ